ncbi:hypothetical protein [Bacillus cereus]
MMKKITKNILVDVAYSLGVKAQKNGKTRVPALDKDLGENCLKGTEIGEGIPILKAWTRGWDDANLGLHVEQEPFTIQVIHENGNTLFEGAHYDAKDHIEKMLCAELGFAPELVEYCETEGFVLHVYSYEGLNEVEMKKLDELGIDHNKKETTRVIKALLHITFAYGQK